MEIQWMEDLNGTWAQEKIIISKARSRERMPIVYQCYSCGKRHKTEQAALDCHDGPIQAIETKVKRDVYRAFYGNMIRKQKKK
jgi:hypothetical protein